MKKIIKQLAFILICTVAFSSCSKDDTVSDLAIITNTVPNGPLANEGVIQLNSSNFTATVEDDWCVIDIQGDKIVVSTTQNNEKVNRSTLIHIVPTDGGDKIIVPITQRGLLFEVNSPTNILNYSLNGGTKKLILFAI